MSTDMGFFKVEKDVPIRKIHTLPEYTKNLIESLDVNESFSFPAKFYRPIKAFIERNQKQWSKKFALRKIDQDANGRIWRLV